MGRFNFQECQRLIELFLELKCMDMWPVLPASVGCAYMDFIFLPLALAAEPECEDAANGAILWHLSRVMYDIDVRRKQRERASKPRAKPLSIPSKILDGLLSCLFFGMHLIYRERLHRAHPESHASLADFRAFVRAILAEWSGMTTVISMASGVILTYISLQTRIYSYVYFADSSLIGLIRSSFFLGKKATVFVACVRRSL